MNEQPEEKQTPQEADSLPPPLPAMASPAPVSQPYGQAQKNQNLDRAPVRVQVVGWLSIVYAGITAFGALSTFFLSSVTPSSMPAGFQVPMVMFGLKLSSGLFVSLTLLLMVGCVFSGIFLLKRRSIAPWFFLALCLILSVNDLFNTPVMLEYGEYLGTEGFQKALEAEGKEVSAQDLEEAKELMQNIMGPAMYASILFGLFIRAVLILLVFSVARWFKGEAVFAPRPS